MKPNVLTVVFCLSMEVCVFAQKQYNITDAGAVADAKTINTESIQKTIDKAFSKKGGRVVVPPGVFVTGSIQLRSGVELHLQQGAVLLGSLNPEHYPVISNRYGLVVATGQTGIAITGKGTIDGRGLELALIIDSLHHAGVRIDPNYNKRRMRPGTRPMIVDFHDCKKVRITGITLKDSPFWVQKHSMCEDVLIDSMNVQSVAFWNNDGIDINGCRNVRITNCFINSADDGICLKSETKEEINDNIYIGNCTIRSSASAVKFGTASFGAFTNIVIENIKVYDTYRSAIALESVDGATIENIQVRNIDAVNTGNAIFIRLGHRDGEHAGAVRNVTVSNVKAEIPFERPDKEYDLRGPDLPFFHNPFPSSVTGIPGHDVENVTLENIEIIYPGRATKGMAYIPVTRLHQVPERENEYPEFSMFGELPAWGFYVRHVNGITMKNVTVKLRNADFRPAFVFDDVKKVNLERLMIPVDQKNPAVVLNESDVPVCDDSVLKLITTIKKR